MHYNKLGHTGLFVSELCFGTMTFGGQGQFGIVGQVQQAEAEALLAKALEAGVNFIDTADTYSDGQAERITGQALKNLGVARSEIVVATKVFGAAGPGHNGQGSSRAHILDAAKASLERMQLDHIDLYQLHGFDPGTPIEESLEALDDLVRQGLVRYVGVSNWAAWQMTKALGISALRGLTKLAAVQAYYTLAGRELEREIIPMLESEGLGLLVWSPLAGGLLSGKVTRAQQEIAGTRRAAFAFPPVEMERGYDVIEVLSALAERKGHTVARLAIAWLLHQKAVTSVILGAKRVEQLIDTLTATSVTFEAAELAQLDAASKLPLEYPGWMIELWSKARRDQVAAQRHPR